MMELMDWKNIETGAENTIREARTQIEVSKVLLREAQKKIKLLGGESNVDINNKARLAREDAKVDEEVKKVIA